MWGLFEKDLRMIMQRKKVFIIFVLLAVFIGYSQVSPEFVLGYIPMLTIIVIVEQYHMMNMIMDTGF